MANSKIQNKAKEIAGLLNGLSLKEIDEVLDKAKNAIGQIPIVIDFEKTKVEWNNGDLKELLNEQKEALSSLG